MITTNRINEHVLWAEINRPESRNAINFQVIEQFEKLVSEIESDEDILVFIFSGAGEQSFIAGGDLKEFHTITKKEDAIEVSKRMQKLFKRIEQLPCWSVAFVNGDAYGGGIETMMAFDFILSAPHSKFGFTQGRFYLTPGWGGLTRLIERVGKSKALEWQGKAEVKLSDEMFKERFLNSIIEKENVLEWIDPLLKNDRDFIQTLKANSGFNSAIRYKKMEAEIEPFADLWVHKNHTDRVESFINKKDH